MGVNLTSFDGSGVVLAKLSVPTEGAMVAESGLGSVGGDNTSRLTDTMGGGGGRLEVVLRSG